ncbi:hypothetical protein SLA2020_267210 [Shorea laevis]
MISPHTEKKRNDRTETHKNYTPGSDDDPGDIRNDKKRRITISHRNQSEPQVLTKQRKGTSLRTGRRSHSVRGSADHRSQRQY